jgi:hypothetical protein
MFYPRLFLPRLAIAVLGACQAWTAPAAHAEIGLPYSFRRHEYSAWGTTVQGDLATVGMAGAMVGLADSRIGSVDNPAGIPLTLDSTGLQIAGNAFQDGHVQSYSSLITTGSTVISLCPYPWGAGLASWAPQSEGDTYVVNGEEQELVVRTREYHLSFANLFLNDRLSIGIKAIVGENSQAFRPLQGGGISHTAWGLGAGIGALYVLPHRVLLGLSYVPPIQYKMSNSDGDIHPQIGDFFQDARSPYRLSLGVGWLPSRFFKASAGLYIFGSTDNTALLSDDTRIVGANMTLQPRFGLSYKMLEYKQLTVQVSAGTYLEVMRTIGDPSRLHGTFALEVKPWILNFGWGIDEARHYQNFIFSAGVDLGKLLSRLKLIPPLPQYPYGGAFPDPTRLSDEGLGHALDSNWKKRDDNVIDIGLRMPGKMREQFKAAPESLKEFGTDFWDGLIELPSDVQGEGVQLWRRGLGLEPKLDTPASGGRFSE